MSKDIQLIVEIVLHKLSFGPQIDVVDESCVIFEMFVLQFICIITDPVNKQTIHFNNAAWRQLMHLIADTRY